MPGATNSALATASHSCIDYMVLCPWILHPSCTHPSCAATCPPLGKINVVGLIPYGDWSSPNSKSPVKSPNQGPHCWACPCPCCPCCPCCQPEPCSNGAAAWQHPVDLLKMGVSETTTLGAYTTLTETLFALLGPRVRNIFSDDQII